jgi:hypothetical protein
MRKVAVSFLAMALVCSLAVPVVWAQTNTPAPNSPIAPAQNPPSTSAQTQPTTPSAPSQTQPATPGSTGQYPTVSNLKPFSAEADYMSLPGYLRYLMYQQTNQWLTYAEARRAVTQQGGQ